MKDLEAAMRAALQARGLAAPEAPQSSTPMTQAEWGGALSAPPDPASYQINVPKGFDRDDALEAKARQWFHRAGLPQGAVSGIVDAYCRSLCGEEGGADAGSRTEAELRQEWGPDYPRKIAAVQALIDKCGGAEEMGHLLSGTGLGNDAWLIRTLAAIAEMQPQTGGSR
ncbi:hypothetical protein [Dongia sp.]|uniref:hypothetical protein n=1 Tax=Dongia sp. TaxID=1977262 RepID=UPI0035B25B0F